MYLSLVLVRWVLISLEYWSESVNLDPTSYVEVRISVNISAAFL